MKILVDKIIQEKYQCPLVKKVANPPIVEEAYSYYCNIDNKYCDLSVNQCRYLKEFKGV